MPELPDVAVYVEALERRIVGATLQSLRIHTPFLLRSVDPPPAVFEGRRVTGAAPPRQAHRVRARGRPLHRDPPDDRRPPALGRRRPRSRRAASRLAAFDFPTGTLMLTEAGTKQARVAAPGARRRALAAHDPGGLEPLAATPADVRRALRRRTTRSSARSPTRACSRGIGNAYSDEILHRARLSPVAARRRRSTTRRSRGCFEATQARARASGPSACARRRGDGFPEKVTAFRPEMAVHGRYRQPCPVCGSPVQRIVLRRERDELLRALPDRRAACSPTARSRACSRTTGRARSRSSRHFARAEPAERDGERDARRAASAPSAKKSGQPSCSASQPGRRRQHRAPGTVGDEQQRVLRRREGRVTQRREVRDDRGRHEPAGEVLDEDRRRRARTRRGPRRPARRTRSSRARGSAPATTSARSDARSR